MSAYDSVAIKKTHKDINLILIGELMKLCDPVVMLSLLEDIKKDLIIKYHGYGDAQILIDTKAEKLCIDVPQSLISKLTNRALIEKCSVDTLCVDYLSRGISGMLKG